VPARNYRDRTTLSPLELVSLILHNRIADLERQGRYDQSVPLALNRAELLAERKNPALSGFFTDPRRDLRDRLLNYGAALLNAGREEEGLRWARYAGSSYADAGGREDPRWQEYIRMLASNRTAKLCRAGRFTEARDFLAEAAPLLDPPGPGELEARITDGELTALVNGIQQAADTAEIAARITEAESAGRLPAPRARELLAHVSLWRVTDYHNRFAGAFNRRDYSLARRILEEALEEFPGDRRLLSDRGVLDRAAPGG
jgi:tetratricopeptide (TPR) repeat protein